MYGRMPPDHIRKELWMPSPEKALKKTAAVSNSDEDEMAERLFAVYIFDTIINSKV